MAKEATKAAKAPKKDYKFGVSDLANLLDTDATYTRVKLRNAGIKKLANDGKAYGWETKEELKALAEKLKVTPAPATKKDKAEAKAPAKKADDKKAASTKADTKKAPAKAEAKAGKTADAKSKDKAAAGKAGKDKKAA